jgi:uncharacterized protein YjaG (DUF416 family)
MPDNVELIVRLHPTSGEDVALWSRDFAGSREALDAIAQALDDRHGLTLTHVRYDGDVSESAVIINLANVVTVRVLETDTSDTTTAGQYL